MCNHMQVHVCHTLCCPFLLLHSLHSVLLFLHMGYTIIQCNTIYIIPTWHVNCAQNDVFLCIPASNSLHALEQMHRAYRQCCPGPVEASPHSAPSQCQSYPYLWLLCSQTSHVAPSQCQSYPYLPLLGNQTSCVAPRQCPPTKERKLTW